MPLPPEIEREQQLLTQLRNSDDPVSRADAVRLKTMYHTRQMALLAADAYDAAKHEGHAPPGWHRFTDAPEWLREFAPGLDQADLARLKRELAPPTSGFRAEIYIPDRDLQELGYRPVMAAKGSGGEIMTTHGLRDTTTEDFLGNNFPQAIGMETDYYDRYMRLSTDLANGHFDFEFSGHSLAGSEATAGAVITGMPATTFNAAALNPETPRRFAEQYGNVTVHNVDHLVNSFETQGDLLTQGVQGTLRDMSAGRRAELANVLQETSRLVTGSPEGRAWLEQEFAAMPLAAQRTATAFVARLADGNVDEMLRKLPQTQGQVHELPAVMRKDGRLVPRRDAMPLSAIIARTGPLWETLDAAAYGAQAGRGAGEGIAVAGRGTHNLLRLEGDALCEAGKAVGGVLQKEHRAAAMALEAGAKLRDPAAKIMPPGLVATAGLDAVPWVERTLARAERWLGDAERDAVAKPACGLAQVWNAEGRVVENVGSRAPGAGAAAGAIIVGGAMSGLELAPVNTVRNARAASAIGQSKSAAGEALDRHSMRDTVLPSINAQIDRAEQQARETLRYDATLHAARTPMQPGDDAAARRATHAVFKGLAAAAMHDDVESMRSIEQVQMHSPLLQQREAQGQEWLMQQQAQAQQQQMQQHQGRSLHH